MREAVIALEVMGLVDVRVGRGVLVLPKAASMRAGASFEARVAALPRVQPDPELPVTIDLNAEIPPFLLRRSWHAIRMRRRTRWRGTWTPSSPSSRARSRRPTKAPHHDQTDDAPD
jgi:hypothetical protein